MPRRRVAAVLVVCLMAALAPAFGASALAGSGSTTKPVTGYRATKTVTRSHVVAGSTVTTDSRTVTVAVDKTVELRGRERVRVSWRGAHPSGGRAANPFGESGLAQEYPVVILQCRGLDKAGLPAAQQLSPSTCFTSTRQQRTQSATDSAAVWRHDLYAADADRAQKSGMSPYPYPGTCPDVSFLSTHITPFVAATGKVFPSCTSDTMPPEAAVGASYPPSEQSAFTDVDGSGTTQFEVRSDVENESLGCNDTTACSLVVIPIMGISCLDADPACNKQGRFAPGSSNFANDGVDDAVSPLYWWSASNWRNRFSVPLSFGLPPDACNVLDSRAPTGFYGSELVSQAALQWSPAYCLRKDRFKFQHNRMPDAAAFSLMEGGQAPAALVSSKQPLEGADPVGYAPTAVTGFAVSYVIDKPDNAGELTRLRLTPRLLAKLLTQSYPASSLGAQHPGMAGNPTSMNLDPEFRRLNPGLDARPREAAATVLSLSQSSDVIRTLTGYLAHDKDAMAFVDGKPDPWGMRVNPSYRGISLPVSEWPLKDTFIPRSDLECLQQNPSVYLSQVAAPVSSLRTIAEAVLDAWPNVQTHCDKPSPDEPFKLGRVDRQGIGARFMLGITSLGDARRFGLRTASLQSSPGHYVAPDDRSLAAAVRHATQGSRLEPFSLPQAALAGDPGAYPATMVVYTAARLANLDHADARKVSQFIRVSTTEGQRPGPGNGQLPAGFLPIRASGPTAPLYRSAQQVAGAVLAQRGAPTSTGSGAPGGGSGGSSSAAGSSGSGAGGSSSGSAAGTTGGGTAPASAGAPGTSPTSATSGGPRAVVVPHTVVSTTATPSEASRLAGTVIPLLLFVGLMAGLGSAAVRLVNRRGRSG